MKSVILFSTLLGAVALSAAPKSTPQPKPFEVRMELGIAKKAKGYVLTGAGNLVFKFKSDAPKTDGGDALVMDQRCVLPLSVKVKNGPSIIKLDEPSGDAKRYLDFTPVAVRGDKIEELRRGTVASFVGLYSHQTKEFQGAELKEGSAIFMNGRGTAMVLNMTSDPSRPTVIEVKLEPPVEGSVNELCDTLKKKGFEVVKN